jgi:hypothetical protein
VLKVSDHPPLHTPPLAHSQGACDRSPMLKGANIVFDLDGNAPRHRAGSHQRVESRAYSPRPLGGLGRNRPPGGGPRYTRDDRGNLAPTWRQRRCQRDAR